VSARLTVVPTLTNVVVLSRDLIRLTRIKKLALAYPAALSRGIACDKAGDTLGASQAFADADRIYAEMIAIRNQGKRHG